MVACIQRPAPLSKAVVQGCKRWVFVVGDVPRGSSAGLRWGRLGFNQLAAGEAIGLPLRIGCRLLNHGIALAVTRHPGESCLELLQLLGRHQDIVVAEGGLGGYVQPRGPTSDRCACSGVCATPSGTPRGPARPTRCTLPQFVPASAARQSLPRAGYPQLLFSFRTRHVPRSKFDRCAGGASLGSSGEGKVSDTSERRCVGSPAPGPRELGSGRMLHG